MAQLRASFSADSAEQLTAAGASDDAHNEAAHLLIDWVEAGDAR
ncbi:MAG: hypothetical protein ACLP0J_17260 [Solirubrobacteraceae bacterium]